LRHIKKIVIFKMEITNRPLSIMTTINLLAKVYTGSEASYIAVIPQTMDNSNTDLCKHVSEHLCLHWTVTIMETVWVGPTEKISTLLSQHYPSSTHNWCYCDRLTALMELSRDPQYMCSPAGFRANLYSIYIIRQMAWRRNSRFGL
jgi:hypothetical protein